jgi:hypothetical protein
MNELALTVLSQEETDARRADGAERLKKIASELRSLRRAEQNAQFEIGRLLCLVADTTMLRIHLPLREERHDVALWAKRETGLSYGQSRRLSETWRVRAALSPGTNEPSTVAQLDPLRPLLKHGVEGKRLINEIWQEASEASNRQEGPSRSLVAKVARDKAPDIIGTRHQKPRSRSRKEARDALAKLEGRFERGALLAAIRAYLKEQS